MMTVLPLPKRYTYMRNHITCVHNAFVTRLWQPHWWWRCSHCRSGTGLYVYVPEIFYLLRPLCMYVPKIFQVHTYIKAYTYMHTHIMCVHNAFVTRLWQPHWWRRCAFCYCSTRIFVLIQRVCKRVCDAFVTCLWQTHWWWRCSFCYCCLPPSHPNCSPPTLHPISPSFSGSSSLTLFSFSVCSEYILDHSLAFHTPNFINLYLFIYSFSHLLIYSFIFIV